MTPSSLWKVEGAGNDFLLGVGAWATTLAERPDLAVSLCRRRRGLGADGVLAVFAAGGDRLRLIYRNADGSRSPFCANGTRCAALAGHRLLDLPSVVVVETDWIDVPARIDEDGCGVALDLPPPVIRMSRMVLSTAGKDAVGALAEVGVPHLILRVADPAALDLPEIAPTLRHHPDLGAEGANVSFVGRSDAGETPIRTWERGVEGETLACGSAVVAAGWMEMHASGADAAAMLTRSGDRLTVSKTPAGVRLEGPARFIARIEPEL